jgi:Mg-chelatase subunit ChlD
MRNIILATAIIFLAITASSFSLTGNCTSTATQCDLSIQNLTACNDSPYEKRFTTSTSGEAKDWVSVLPETFILRANECRELNVYAIANCYAEPGIYPYSITVSGETSQTINCQMNIRQGHFLDVEINPKTHNANQCEEKTYYVTLTNNSIIPNQLKELVKLEINGFPGNWGILEKTELEVTKGNPEILQLRVKAPCEQPIGNYPFEIKAKLYNENFVSGDTATHKIKEGQNLIIIASETIEGCTEREERAFINFKNNGAQNDEYDIELINAPSWVQLTQNTLQLNTGDSKDIELIIQKTSSTQETEFTIKASSKKFNYTTEKTIKAESKNCYGISINLLEGKTSICNNEEAEYIFEVKNLKERETEVELNTIGAQGTLSKQKILLGPFGKQNIVFALDTENIAQQGEAHARETKIQLLFDTSGSMRETINEKPKMDIAKATATNFLRSITNEVKIGLRVFGQGIGCEPSQILNPIKELDREKIEENILSLAPIGKTPLAEALKSAAGDFGEKNGNYIILVSDGKETCKGSIDEAIKALNAQQITVYAIGFDIDEEGKAELKKIVENTNGTYFDAKNAEDLTNAFEAISVNLKIKKAKTETHTIQIEAKSKYANATKSVSFTAQDCYNSALSVSALNMCKGIPKTGFFKITNLGTKNAEYALSAVPSWINIPKKINVPAGESATVPFEAYTETEKEREFTIKAETETHSISQTKPITYMSKTSCFGIDLIVISTQIDATTCEGEKFELYIENRGMATQTVYLETDTKWVYLAENKITLSAGERKETHYFVTPPFDLESPGKKIRIKARTDYGFETELEIFINKTGSTYGLEKVDISVENTSNEIIEITDHTQGIIVTVELTNNSNRMLRINEVEAVGYRANINVENTELNPHEKTVVELQLFLDENADGRIVVPLSFKTNQGNYVRNIEVEVKQTQEKTEETEEQSISIGSGLVSLAGISGAVLGLLLLLLIGFRGLQKSNENKKPEETKPVRDKTKKPTAKKTRKPKKK